MFSSYPVPSPCLPIIAVTLQNIHFSLYYYSLYKCLYTVYSIYYLCIYIIQSPNCVHTTLCHSGKTEANFYQSDSKSHTQIHNLHMLCKSCCAYIFALNMQQIDVEKCTKSANFYNMTRCLTVYFVLTQLKIYFGTKTSSYY